MDEILTDEGLFDDYEVTAEESTEPTEEVIEETTETSEENSEPETVEPFGLKIKYNGEERTLNEEEARTLAQKGMNYDRFYEPLDRLARMNNMSVGDYVNKLNDTQVQFEISKEIETLREDPKYANLDEDVLNEIAQGRVNTLMGERDKYYQSQLNKQAESEQLAAQKEIDKFFEEYPEFRNKGPETLDPKVFEYVKKGYTLLEAYNKYQREQVNLSQSEAKARASQLNEQNKKKALGNTSNAGDIETDAFLSGLNG